MAYSILSSSQGAESMRPRKLMSIGETQPGSKTVPPDSYSEPESTGLVALGLIGANTVEPNAYAWLA